MSLNTSTDHSARLLAAIVESSDDAIVSKDLTGVVRTWNRGAERIFGYTAEEMIGRSIRTIIPADRQHEEDRVLASIIAGERVEHFDTIRCAKDGRLVPISLSVSPIRDASGQVIGASKIARDISDRKRLEVLAEKTARRESFLAHVTLALTRSLEYEETLNTLAGVAVPSIGDYCAVDILDDEGKLRRIAVAHADPEKARIGEELGGDQYAHPESAPQRVLRSGKPEFVPQVSDDAIVSYAGGDPERAVRMRALGFASFMCVPIMAHDRMLGTLSLATSDARPHYTDEDVRFAEDVASRAALAIENAQAYHEAQTANQLKDEFLATLSHELRTPLNAVLGYARMLRTGAIRQDRADQALDVIERNADALRQIVEDVLDVSRIISGKAKLEVRPTDMARVLQDAIATVQPAADAKNIHIERRIERGIGPVSADPNRLQQVIWNLLSNAVKFTPAGGRIDVRLEHANDHAQIVVKDTGIGLSASFLPHVFERFRQAEGGTARRHGGLGLGLAIARHIVEMHGGTIQAASDGEGKGSTFTVMLPLMGYEAEASRAGRERDRRRGADATDLEGIRVLAVDDDEDALYLVREILEAAGADVVTVTSAGAALDTLPTQRPHVVVADLGMPEMDGFELIKEIRQLTDAGLRHVPVAALTAYARSADRARALRSGFEMHLAKPIDPAELVAAVNSLARRQQQPHS